MNKNFTKVILLMCVIFIALPCIAQEAVKRTFSPKHELSMSIGLVNMLPYSNFSGFPDHGHWYEGFSYDSFYWSDTDFSNEGYDRLLYNYGPCTSTGAISLGYHYDVLRWLSVGATFSYAGVYHKKFDRTTNKIVGKQNNHNFLLAPKVRFSYLNRPMVRLYSQATVGVVMNQTKIEGEGRGSYSYNEWTASGQFTYFGVAVGRKFFGFAEVGFGFQGVIVMGVGYKFNNKDN